MKRVRAALTVWLIVLLVLVALPYRPAPTQAAPPATCGVWRWGIKTLSDADAAQVNFTPRARTIRTLRKFTAPGELSKTTSRLSPLEFHTYRVRARLLQHKWVCCGADDDGDFHLVIADPKNRKRTMIAEISDPDCPGAVDSVRATALRAVRKEYADLFGQPPKGKFVAIEDSPVVILIGVGFFDAVHGQKGVATNGVELHPILDIEEINGGG